MKEAILAGFTCFITEKFIIEFPFPPETKVERTARCGESKEVQRIQVLSVPTWDPF